MPNNILPDVCKAPVICPESPVVIVDRPCVTSCCDVVVSPCGATHPVGSGTIAGCNSTTNPHIGVIMGKTEGNCVPFAYYTSGNTKDYENNCGNLDQLSHVETKAECCPPVVAYDSVSCDCFELVDGNGGDDDNTVQNIVDINGVKYMILEDGTQVAMPIYHDLENNPVT